MMTHSLPDVRYSGQTPLTVGKILEHFTHLVSLGVSPDTIVGFASIDSDIGGWIFLDNFEWRVNDQTDACLVLI